MITTPLPGETDPSGPTNPSVVSLQPLPGTLFGSSPHLVASAVTRGERRKTQRSVWST
jgi:hypothetical protein